MAAPASTLRRLDPDTLGDHLDRLYRAAWAMCGDRHEAEDLVQDTYAAVLARPRWLRRDDDLGYLLKALRNAHLARLRAAGRRPDPVALDAVAEPEDRRMRWRPEAMLDVAALFDAIAALPADFRDAVVAVDVAGLSYGEAAGVLRVRTATLTTRLHRGRARLARGLTESTTQSGGGDG